VETIETTVYKVKIGTAALALFTHGTPERPIAVGQKLGDKNDIYRYTGYGEVEFDTKLFAKPENVKIEDSKA
jgi:hypothetical protein